RRIRDVPDLHPAVIALNVVPADEGEIRVGEPAVARRARVEEVLRRRGLRDHPEVPRRFAGVHPPRAEAHPRIGAGHARGEIRPRSGPDRGGGGRRGGGAPSERGEGDAKTQGRKGGKAERRKDGRFWRHGFFPWVESAASIALIRSISVVWSAFTSEANLNT